MRIILTGFLVCSVFFSFAQLGSIRGKVFDKDDNYPAIGAVVNVYFNDIQKTGAVTDANGIFTVEGLQPGTYSLKIEYHGKSAEVTNVQVIPNEETDVKTIDLTLEEKVSEVVVTADPIDPNRPVDRPISGEQFQRAAQSDITESIQVLTPSLVSSGEGRDIFSGGARSEGTQIYVNGIKQGGTVTRDAIDQAQVLTSGLSARYGDVMGSIINISTKGVSRKPYVQLRGTSSQFLDAYGYNYFSGVGSVPIIWKKDEEGKKLRPLVGLFLAGEVTYQKDDNPSAVGVWRAKKEVLDSLEQTPLMLSPFSNTLITTSSFLRKEDLEKVKAKDNTQQLGAEINPRIDFALSDDIDLTIGGGYQYNGNSGWDLENSLLNTAASPFQTQNNLNTYVRFTQRLDLSGENTEGTAEKSFLSGAYYTIQADYVNNNTKTAGHPDHEFNPFQYGHIGEYDVKRMPSYRSVRDPLTGRIERLEQTGWTDIAVNFTPGPYNPLLARYTELYYELLNSNPRNYDQIQVGNGLLNGQNPPTLYSLYFSPGRVGGSYSRSNYQQFRITMNANVNLNFKNGSYSKEARDEALKNDMEYNVDEFITHKLQFGFEYEQRSSSSYTVVPGRLWPLMRNLTNRHISDLDTLNPIITEREGFDVYNYNRLYRPSLQSYFDKQLRKKLGYAVNSLDFINTDAVDPEMLSLEMFSPDELLNNAFNFNSGTVVGALGYDYLGNRFTEQPSFNDYFTEKGESGNYLRRMGANRPIYAAAFIEDVFKVQDLFFRFGLRFDRYDVNTKVMRDMFSLYPIRTASEVDNLGAHPSNIGDGFAVYVDDRENPQRIVGYRNDRTWYNADGEEISNPELITRETRTGSIEPYLVQPAADITDPNTFDPNLSFKDYEPELKISPRMSFRFKLTDQSLFFAHYDVRTQRPNNNFVPPATYYFFNQVNTINNPNLKMQQNIDYEAGFQQQLGMFSSIALSGYYREFRDLIQIVPVNFAFPKNYQTYDNFDFGTVKGFKIRYDLGRPRGESGIMLSINYTLQYAEGTGSSPTSQASLLSAGVPNLRAIVPLSYDRRHSIGGNIDFRFADKPKSKILKHSGFNILFTAGSGFPYNRTNEPLRTAQFGVQQRSTLKGSLNGSRRPWTSRIDVSIDKDIPLATRTVVGMDKPIVTSKLNIYLAIRNVLNTRNILGVYGYTGVPDDDGFLSSALGQSYVDGLSSQLDPQSFVDLYSIKMNNPGLYDLPRRIRLGAVINF